MSTATTTAPTKVPTIGARLRDWRQKRRLSQLDLALEAEISTRHLSFLETGRAAPSRDMVLRLAEWRGHILSRLRRQLADSGDAELADLIKELSAYPGGEAHPRAGEGLIAAPLRLKTPGGELSFLSATMTFGSPLDVMVSELA